MTENRKTNLILSERKAKVGVGGLTGPIPFLSDFSASTCTLSPALELERPTHKKHHCTFISFSATLTRLVPKSP